MVTQEEKAVRRIQHISKIIKEGKEFHFEDLEAWALVNQGISEQTLGRYLNALTKLNMISFNINTKIITWIEKDS